MSEIYYLITVVQKEVAQSFVTFYQSHGIRACLGTIGNGTTRQKTLDYLGIERTEKAILSCLIYKSELGIIMHQLITKMNIDLPNTGIAIAIPVISLSTGMEAEYLNQEESKKGAGRESMGESHFSLIIVITASGTTDSVMEAAKGAGAKGGTVLHVKGTRGKEMERFFGISLAAEKEMIYLVVRREERSAIMRAIVENDDKARVFAVPVEAVAGLRNLLNEQN